MIRTVRQAHSATKRSGSRGLVRTAPSKLTKAFTSRNPRPTDVNVLINRFGRRGGSADKRRSGGVDGRGDGFGGGGLHDLAVDQHGRGGRDAALDRLVGELCGPWGVIGGGDAGGRGGVGAGAVSRG